MKRFAPVLSIAIGAGLLAGLLGATGCQPKTYRQKADDVALSIIEQGQQQALGHDQPFTIEQPSETLRRRLLQRQGLPYSGNAALGVSDLTKIDRWPEADYPPADQPYGQQGATAFADPMQLSMVDALMIAARNSREYQTRKEQVFQFALDLDLEQNDFRYLFFGTLESRYIDDPGDGPDVRGMENTATGTVTKQLKTGAALTLQLALDLVKLLSLDRSSSFGILADATITVPLLRGAGSHIVTEPLTQAERDVVYSILSLERFKRTLAVQVATEYLSALQQLDQVRNSQENYRRLVNGVRRARRLADAGRLPEIQVDQARQDELRARDRWITSQQSYERRLDSLKLTMGLPTDARIELGYSELQQMAEQAQDALRVLATQPAATTREQPVPADAPVILVPPSKKGGPLEIAPAKAIELAFERREDLSILHGRVFDAQRKVVVAADALQAGLTLAGTAEAGGRRRLSTAGLSNAQLRPEQGIYTVELLVDLPLERTAERNAYRNSYIVMARAVRAVQELEDRIKQEIRDELRSLLQARESFQIQDEAARLAERRVTSTALFLQAGRAEVRDVLESQEALLSAQNARTAALVAYRVSALELQRDMGVLKIDSKGLWSEYRPDDKEH